MFPVRAAYRAILPVLWRYPFTGYICLAIGVLMLIVSLLGGRFQGDKVMRAAVMIVAGAVLMNLVESYL